MKRKAVIIGIYDQTAYVALSPTGIAKNAGMILGVIDAGRAYFFFNLIIFVNTRKVSTEEIHTSNK